MEGKKIWVAGHTGLVGSSLCRRLKSEGCELLTVTHPNLDLTRQAETEEWLVEHKPDGVIIAAAHVGGIHANNTYPAEFIYNNLAMAQNIIHGSYLAGVKKLLFLGSSCIYPKLTNSPIQENALLRGSLEPTNEPYAVSKIAGIKLCESYRYQYDCDFISAMPCNLYGARDSYNLENSHVIPALIIKIHNAKEQKLPSVEVWGSGKPLREFLYADDLADALIHLFVNYSDTQHINVGAGYDISISELAQTICDVIGYKGNLNFNTDKPDGVMQKLMDSSKIQAMGWKPKIDLKSGLDTSYQDYLNRVLKHAA
ncbi:MAG: GDP-L-fucose synthase [Robiginitomaculum sp.]|nr:GDP-L-fucose synthase [Robiginitomaculum sp.]